MAKYLLLLFVLFVPSAVEAQGFRPSDPYYLDYIYGPPRYYIRRNRVLFEPQRPAYPPRRYPVQTIDLRPHYFNK